MSKLPFVEQKRKPLPGEEHRFFTPRSPPAPHPPASDIAATLPDIFAALLHSNNCELPLRVSVKVNSHGAVTVIVSDVETPAVAYVPFFDALTSRLNKSFPVGSSPWLPFRLAPNEAHLAIHSLPISYLPDNPEMLFNSIVSFVRNAKGVNILFARYLNPDPASREGKFATSVAITIRPQDLVMMGSSVCLFSNPRHVTPIVPTNRFPQCDNCWQFSHVAVRSTQPHPTSPFCSLHYTKAAHRCLNLVCPKGGNLRPVLSCCDISAAKCPTCGEPQLAMYRDCSARPVPSAPPPPPPPQPSPAPEEEMNTAEDSSSCFAPSQILFPDTKPATPPAGPSCLVPPSQIQTSSWFAAPPPSRPVSPTFSTSSARTEAD